MSPLRIEPDAGVYPAAWCSCGAQWLTSGIGEFFEGGLLHGRANCWPRPRAAATLDLQQALDVTYPCCWHCPCTGLQHVTACTVPGCEGQVGS